MEAIVSRPLVMVVWRRREDNAMAFSRLGTMFFVSPVVALRNVRESLVPGAKPEEYDDPTCGPGPFSMANADTVTDMLLHAGYTEISLRRCDMEIPIGNDMDGAIDLRMSLGPAGEILRLQGERAAHLHGKVEAALRDGLREFQREDGSIWAPASTWIVSASNPV